MRARGGRARRRRNDRDGDDDDDDDDDDDGVDAARDVAPGRAVRDARLGARAGARDGARDAWRGRSRTRAAATRGERRDDEDEDEDEDETLDVGVFVTGWSSGIGRASALALAAEGFAIVAPYRLGGVDAANAFARACRRAAKDSRVELVGPLDLGSERDVMKVSLSEMRRRGVDVRAVVHCAAVFNTDGNATRRGDGSPTARVNFRNVARLTDRLVDEARRAGKDKRAHAGGFRRILRASVRDGSVAGRGRVSTMGENGRRGRAILQPGDRLHVEQSRD